MTKPEIRLINIKSKWTLGGKTASIPFLTLLHNLDPCICTNCQTELETGQHIYIISQFKELQNWKNQLIDANNIHLQHKLLQDEPIIYCESCYINEAKNQWYRKALKAKAEGKPQDTQIKITFNANRAIISNNEHEKKLLEIHKMADSNKNL